MRVRHTFVVALLNVVAVSAAQSQTVVEYVNQADFPLAPGGQYFYTADEAEKAYVDSGAAGAFKRTGAQFPLGGPASICRFYGSVSPGPNSHFYTAFPEECAQLRAAQLVPTPKGVQQWNYESSALRATIPTIDATGARSCPAGTMPVYRAYNNAYPAIGGKNAWDSNHRYSARLADIRTLVNAGWISDNIGACVPTGPDQAALPASASLEDQCAAPRAEPKYGYKPGSLETEKAWINTHVDERYLWTENAPHVAFDQVTSASALFSKRLSPFTSSGGAKQDRFSAFQNTSDFENTQAGNIGGYGYSYSAAASSPPRNFVIRYVEPGSPAAFAGITRGMKFIEADGVNFVSGSNTTALNGALNPILNTTHNFVFERPDGTTLPVTMTAGVVARQAAQTVATVNTPSGKVGYLHVTTFNTYSGENQLITAMRQLHAENVKDLVLDMRYNGGGFIYQSNQLAYMIAGAKSIGKTYYQFAYNSKRDADTNAPNSRDVFRTVATGFSGTNTTAGAPLPTLNLARVYVLTGTGTASASEAIINALRGIDVEVILIGTTTVGKPYGSLPRDNCGITYSMLEFRGTNAKGEGDFNDGLAATCNVADDFSNALGSESESRLQAALYYRANGACQPGTATADSAKSGVRLIDAPEGGANPMAMGAFDLPIRLKQKYVATERVTAR
jgi:carboxyl-terminal processing protease